MVYETMEESGIGTVGFLHDDWRAGTGSQDGCQSRQARTGICQSRADRSDNKTWNNIYVKDSSGACVPFTAYYYDSNGNKQGERVSSKENDSEYGKMNEAVYADFIYESVRCEQINGDYFVHIYEGEDTHPKKDTPPSDSGGSGSESCHHNFEWVTVQEATAIADAVLAYECTNCGRVTDYMKEPNSAFAQFNKESTASIETAQKDAAVTLDTDIWNSFQGSVFKAPCLPGRTLL